MFIDLNYICISVGACFGIPDGGMMDFCEGLLILLDVWGDAYMWCVKLVFVLYQFALRRHR